MLLVMSCRIDTHNPGIEVTTGTRLPLEEQPIPWDDEDMPEEMPGDESDNEGNEEESKELAQRLSAIRAIMADLYRLSFKIRNVSTRSTSTKALLHKDVDPDTQVDLISAFAELDRRHVQESLPHLQKTSAQEGEFMVERLSKAITNRRRYFAYWRRHALKLATVSATDQGAKETVTDPSEEGNLGPQLSGPKTILSGTEATKFDRKLDDQLDSQTVISYASTAYDSHGNAAELPPPPSEASSKSEFRCSYCCLVCPSWQGKGKSWR